MNTGTPFRWTRKRPGFWRGVSCLLPQTVPPEAAGTSFWVPAAQEPAPVGVPALHPMPTSRGVAGGVHPQEKEGLAWKHQAPHPAN